MQIRTAGDSPLEIIIRGRHDGVDVFQDCLYRRLENMSTSPADTQEFHPSSSQPMQPTPHSSVVKVDVAGLSHTGYVRHNNEDHFLVFSFGRFLETLTTNLPANHVPPHYMDDGYGMIVADGIGGHLAGEHASRMAITTMVNLVLSTPDWILRADDPLQADEIMNRARDRFEMVGDVLTEEAAADPKLHDFATTMTLAASAGKDLFIAHVGDSRAYLLRHDKLIQLTRDHTFASELVEAGMLTHAEAATHRLRHVLTRFIGTTQEATPDVQKLSLQDGDRLVLCSDGLNNMISNDEIKAILGQADTSEKLSNRLVDEALQAGGHDNVTVIVAQYSVNDA
jgi:protein phosphatase